MSAPDSGESVPLPRDATRSELSGVADNVVQARDVQGGVHFHRTGPAAPDAPRQLPGDIRGFVNRATELGWLDAALSQRGRDTAAIIVIVGTAGVGKTALALRWAHRARESFPDGQLYVNLRGYDPGAPVTAEQALDRFLRALEVPAERIPADPDAKATLYRSLLADRRVLVVLDNAASVAQVRPLLPGGDGCRVVITSRSRLAGLVARDGAQRITVEILPEDESVELIRSITADYRHADDPADVAELARLCACLPLALRIAAERAAARPWMPLSELIQALRDESGLWDALSVEDGEEADAVRTVFAWSYRALPVEAARMFRLLGLHPGPEFGAHAAAALADVEVSTARRLLDNIVGAHLVEQISVDRYQFHDLLRAYATDAAHHEESLGQQYEALNRVLAWYLHTAYAAGTALGMPLRLLPPTALPASTMAVAFAAYLDAERWYDTERANLLAAVQAADKSGQDRTAWQLALLMEPIFVKQGSIADRHRVVLTALDAARRDGDLLAEAEARSALASVHTARHQLNEAVGMYREVLALRRELGDVEGEIITANSLGVMFLHVRRFADAAEQFERNRALCRDLGSTAHETTSLFNLADAYHGLGRYPEAIEAAHRSLEMSRELGDQWRELVASMLLANAQADSGAVADALSSAESGLALARARNDQRDEGWALLEYGRIQRLAGRHSDALVSYQRATTLHIAVDNRGREVESLNGTGEAYQGLDRMADAADFHRRAVTIARDLDDSWLLAVSLDNLGTALAATGGTAEARTCWREAARLLDGYTDPATRERHSSITDRLG
ncbi:ATP-binding protein [Saccharopolyspora sp. 5N708]|uniref:ATP-binding protein n=1 Tax=Saccharopolyspora sp. 5N708 TaxID=3457424 RepID=UPI003FD3234D